MSVRVWQLAAFAYVLVLMLVALEVPLNLNLSRRVSAISSPASTTRRWAMSMLSSPLRS